MKTKSCFKFYEKLRNVFLLHPRDRKLTLNRVVALFSGMKPEVVTL